MIKQAISKIDWKLGAFFLIIAIGVFLRVWHFSDWLFFKLDQARDSFLILQAYEKGIEYLPLLGPRAGGTNLLLGPAYYYFQYISLIITQNTHPAAFAYPDLIFSILAIPTFYVLLKKYFDRNWSLILASVLSLNFFAIEYSRFSWNPNPLPFFTILFFLSILNIFDEREKRKTLWIIIAAVSFSVASQLHFLAFLAFPTIIVLFVFFQWRNLKKFISLKRVGLFLLIFFLAYLPWLLNDIESPWRNLRNIRKAFLTKSFSTSFSSQILSGFNSFGENWLTILTGYVSSGKMIAATIFGRYYAVDKTILIAVCVWILFIIPSLALNWKLAKSEKDPARKRFLLLVLLWFLTFCAVYIPIGNQLRPRYFLATLALPMIYLGFDLLWLKKKIGKFGALFVFAALAVVFAGNLAGTQLWFQEIRATQTQDKVNSQKTFIFKGDDGVVLWHIEQAVRYMKENCQGKQIYYTSYPVYIKSIYYMLKYQDVRDVAVKSDQISEKNACFYAVAHTTGGMRGLHSSVSDNYTIADRQKFGKMSVYHLLPKNNDVNIKKFYSISDVEVAKETRVRRILWKDIFTN